MQLLRTQVASHYSAESSLNGAAGSAAAPPVRGHLAQTTASAAATPVVLCSSSSSGNSSSFRPAPRVLGDPPAAFVPSSRPATAVTCSAYSRSSWRMAILSEGDGGFYDAEVPRDSSNSQSQSFGDTIAADSEYTKPDSNRSMVDSDGDNTLMGGELRVKLALAASSGRLDLTDCRLPRLPVEVLELTELEELQLSGNRLTGLPNEISKLTALRRLGLAGNLLSCLPPGIGALTGLEGLWLHGNQIVSLPEQLGNLGALRALSLAGNCLESVPKGSLYGLTALTDLTLAGNRLEALPPGELAPLSRLRKLALNGNRLTTEAAGNLGLGAHMTGLTELMLQGNRLEEVDADIFELPALQELSLADNQLVQLPARMSGATSLSRLHLFGNRLTSLTVSQLASIPSLSSCWLEGNPLRGEVVEALLAAVGRGAMPRLKALGLDRSQVKAAATAVGVAASGQGTEAGDGDGVGSSRAGSIVALPPSVRVGCVLGSGPGYFKLQYGPRRAASAVSGSASSSTSTSATAEDSVCSNGNDLLVVAFGSAPGTPNWAGLLSKVYQAAASDDGRYFDVLYVADPTRDWYGGGDDDVYSYYRDRLSAYTRHYRRALLLGDSMGATAALLFSDLATAALAFCPQVDLTAASIRPGRPAAWLSRLQQRLVAAVRASQGELTVLVGTWQHDLAQANLVPTHDGMTNDPQEGRRDTATGNTSYDTGVDVDRARTTSRQHRARGGVLRGWREASEERTQSRAVGGGLSQVPPASCAGPVGTRRKPWAWEQRGEGDAEGEGDGGSLEQDREVEGAGSLEGAAAGGDLASGLQVNGDGASRGARGGSGSGGVKVKVFSVDSHRLAAALDARGQLVPLVRDAVRHELGLPSGNVRVANLL